MKETEYIIITNRVKISNAIKILRDVLPEKNYGVESDKFKKILAELHEIECELFSLQNIAE